MRLGPRAGVTSQYLSQRHWLEVKEGEHVSERAMLGKGWERLGGHLQTHVMTHLSRV